MGSAAKIYRRMIDVEAVKAENLCKTYKGKEIVQALKGVDLSINKGELFTLLGLNGAGKTTLLRIVSTQLSPTMELLASWDTTL